MKILLLFCLVYTAQLKVAPSNRVKRQSYGMMGNNNNYNSNNYGNNNNNNYNGRNSYGANNYGRANVQGCQVLPSGADQPETPAHQGTVVEIQCNTDAQYDSCSFTHTTPFNVGQSYGGNTNTQDFKCSITPDSSASNQCGSDPRISVIRSSNMCGLRISNPQPDDIGIWRVYVNELKTNGQNENSQKEVNVYTFNQTRTRLQEKRTEDEIPPTFVVNYNYDDWRDEWKDGKSGYERYELQCNAQYGRPTPELTWSINRVDMTSNNIFTIRDGKGDTHDPSGLVYDWTSDISFEVNREFLDYLYNEHGIDTNPQSGEFTFDLECNADQGNNGEYYSERAYTRVSVKRLYNPGGYTTEEIGGIVGGTIGGLVLIIIIIAAVFIFLKSTGRIFADEDYRYRDPQDNKQIPTHAQR